jgi:adenosyl cobinamide kinase/adenosyl cobinamide phosphate guanylyltransferase
MSATSILVVGESGSGKSTAAENLPSEQTFVINVASKNLPFKGWKSRYTEFNKANPKGNLLNSDNTDVILATLDHINTSRPEIKYIVLDDSQYIAANKYMALAKQTGFQKFTDIALDMHKLATKPKALRDDLFVFFLSHAEEGTDINNVRRLKAKTLGKMIDNTITYEGLFSIVLFTYKEETKTGTEYGFITNGDPNSTAKSPRGMFETAKIPNDLLQVVLKIKEYEA